MVSTVWRSFSSTWYVWHVHVELHDHMLQCYRDSDNSYIIYIICETTVSHTFLKQKKPVQYIYIYNTITTKITTFVGIIE